MSTGIQQGTTASIFWDWLTNECEDGEWFMPPDIADELTISAQNLKLGCAFLAAAGVLERELVPGRGSYRYRYRKG